MIPMQTFKNLLTLALAFVTIVGLTYAQTEHPEGKEHPSKEHPKDQSAKKQLTIEEFADAAEQYIKRKSQANEGYFPVKDKMQGKTLKLKLQKIHRKRLAHLGNDEYFVCANFEGQDGKTYDIDIFMKGTNKNNLEATRKPTVHKINGDARFSYYKNDKGIWKRKGKEKYNKKAKEHPKGSEHPKKAKEHPEGKEHPKGKEHPEGKEHPNNK